MPLVESLVGPLASLLDKLIPDKEARAKAKLELLALEGTQELRVIETRLSAILAEGHERLSRRAARAALRSLRDRLSRLHGGAPVGQGQGRGSVRLRVPKPRFPKRRRDGSFRR